MEPTVTPLPFASGKLVDFCTCIIPRLIGLCMALHWKECAQSKAFDLPTPKLAE